MKTGAEKLGRLQFCSRLFMLEPHHTPPSYKDLLKHALVLVLALGLLWYAFKGIDLYDIWNYTKNLQPLPVFLVLVSGVLGNFLRSYRWTLLLRPLKGESEPKISQFNSFYAVSMGYAVNVFAPRGGEIARLLSICKSENLPWAGVLPTLLIDRLLDVTLLLAVFGVTLLILPPALLNRMPWLQSGGLILLAFVSVGLVVLPFVGTIFARLLKIALIQQMLSEKLRHKLFQLADQFNQGSLSLKNFALLPLLTLVSICMWFTYWLNFYLMILGFGFEDTVDAAQCLIIFAIGSIGSLIPTPSSAGGFHLLVKEAAVMSAKLNPAQAIAYATVLHFVTIIVVSLLPALVLWLFKRYQDKP